MSRSKILFALFLLLGTNARSQQLVLYTMPSPRTLNWRSPHTLAMSYLRNVLVPVRYQGHRHPMGHMVIELRDTARYALVGATTRSKKDLAKSVIKHKYGLGALFAGYSGRLESQDDNYHQLTDRYPHGDIAYIQLLINTATFERLWQYLQEYQQRGYDSIYNGANRPREGKGAGCSAFAVSFLEIGRLLDSSVTEQWAVHVNAQEKLVGGPEGNGRKIGLLRMLFTQRWADTGRERYKHVTYYEPRRVFDWINQNARQADSSLHYTPGQKGCAAGLIMNKRNTYPPQEDIWLK
jgi:hypothetical protein